MAPQVICYRPQRWQRWPSNRTISHAHRVLSKALKEASKFDLVSKNVATTQQPPTPEEEEVVIVPQEQLKELLAELTGRALFTGARRSEMLAMRYRYLDLDRKNWEICESLEETKKHGIRVKKPKTKAGRRHITLPDIVVTALREHCRAQLELRMKLGLGRPSPDDFVFPSWMAHPEARERSVRNGRIAPPRSGCLTWCSMPCGTPTPHS